VAAAATAAVGEHIGRIALLTSRRPRAQNFFTASNGRLRDPGLTGLTHDHFTARDDYLIYYQN
jgi:hypothetical protein